MSIIAETGTSNPSAQDRREHIIDPGMRVQAPSSMLAAIGNAHVNLSFATSRLDELLRQLADVIVGDYQECDPLVTALDYARDNARLTWRLEAQIDQLWSVLGSRENNDDDSLRSMG